MKKIVAILMFALLASIAFATASDTQTSPTKYIVKLKSSSTDLASTSDLATQSAASGHILTTR